MYKFVPVHLHCTSTVGIPIQLLYMHVCQGSISISKAGIVATLKARCAVVASVCAVRCSRSHRSASCDTGPRQAQKLQRAHARVTVSFRFFLALTAVVYRRHTPDTATGGSGYSAEASAEHAHTHTRTACHAHLLSRPRCMRRQKRAAAR